MSIGLVCGKGRELSPSTVVGEGQGTAAGDSNGAGRRGLMDPAFAYTRSDKTDLKKTFARIRRELAQAEAAKTEPKVRPIRQQKKGT